MDWVAIGTFVAGLVSGYTLKLVIDIRVNRSKSQIGGSGSDHGVAQHGNRAGGNIVGGDYAGRDINRGPTKGRTK